MLASNPESDKDKDAIELVRALTRGISKHGVRKFTDKVKEIDISDRHQNYVEVRDFIISEVCNILGVEKDQVIGKGQRGVVTTARKIAVVTIKTHFTDISDEELGRFFDGRARQVIYKIMKEYEGMDRGNRLDKINFFDCFDIVNSKTEEFKKTILK
jgi:chromosomal replication initiation ATPase DnaA